MALFDPESSSGEDYIPPLKRFKINSLQSHYEWSLSEEMT